MEKSFEQVSSRQYKTNPVVSIDVLDYLCWNDVLTLFFMWPQQLMLKLDCFDSSNSFSCPLLVFLIQIYKVIGAYLPCDWKAGQHIGVK